MQCRRRWWLCCGGCAPQPTEPDKRARRTWSGGPAKGSRPTAVGSLEAARGWGPFRLSGCGSCVSASAAVLRSGPRSAPGLAAPPADASKEAFDSRVAMRAGLKPFGIFGPGLVEPWAISAARTGPVPHLGDRPWSLISRCLWRAKDRCRLPSRCSFLPCPQGFLRDQTTRPLCGRSMLPICQSRGRLWHPTRPCLTTTMRTWSLRDRVWPWRVAARATTHSSHFRAEPSSGRWHRQPVHRAVAARDGRPLIGKPVVAVHPGVLNLGQPPCTPRGCGCCAPGPLVFHAVSRAICAVLRRCDFPGCCAPGCRAAVCPRGCYAPAGYLACG